MASFTLGSMGRLMGSFSPFASTRREPSSPCTRSRFTKQLLSIMVANAIVRKTNKEDALF